MYCITMDDYIKLSDCSYQDIYSFLESSVEEDDQLRIEDTGRVSYYIYDIREEKEYAWNAGTLVKVEYGEHRLIIDRNTDFWIAYQGPGEEA